MATLLKVLIIEDDAELLAMSARYLTLKGFLVLGGSTLNDLVQILDVMVPDVVLTDINLQCGETGYNVLEAVVAMGLPIPVIACSGTMDAYLASMEGFTEVLAKPYCLDKLVETLSRVTIEHGLS